MVIGTDSIVTLHYTLKDDAGVIIDQSAPGEPLAYLHGHGGIIAGLEKELTGRSAGDALCVTVRPAEGYGEYDNDLVQSVPRRALRGIENIKTGMRLHAQTAAGTRAVTVTKVIGDLVTLDGNHPLAGKSLHFDVRIEAVRAATEEELAHGHVHGPHGHHEH
jgi:FKBP-type peptidyl-prolyl cis-trans isomerase SlyD